MPLSNIEYQQVMKIADSQEKGYEECKCICFMVVSAQAYLLFSNLIKLSFRPWHLLIHESFTTGEVSFEYNAEELGNVFTLLANLEESGTGIRH